MDDMGDIEGAWESERKSWDCKATEGCEEEAEPHSFHLIS
jgi:hypothetical protein